MDEIKEVGQFMYQYLEEEKVAVAHNNLISHMTGPMVVSIKMRGLAKYSDKIYDMSYNGVNYVGCIYEGIQEDELVKALS